MFKVGQKVECVRAWFDRDGLTIGKKYEVLSLGELKTGKLVWVVDDEGDCDWFPITCFKEVE